MSEKQKDYDHGLSDEEIIKEALEFCDEELAGFKGFDLSKDRYYCCVHAEKYIRNLASRLNNRNLG